MTVTFFPIARQCSLNMTWGNSECARFEAENIFLRKNGDQKFSGNGLYLQWDESIRHNITVPKTNRLRCAPFVRQ